MIYFLKRCLYIIPVMIGVSMLTFGLSQLIPGDPAEILLRQQGVDPTSAEIAVLREEMGLNDPMTVQYGRWLNGALQGDLGKSYRTGQPVMKEIIHRLPATLELTLAGLLVMICIAFPLGILSAIYKNTWIDGISRVLAFMGASLPSFWLGLMFIYYFSVRVPIFPVTGRGTLRHLILPALTLGLGMSATYARLIRSSMLEVLDQEYILVLRSRGLKERIIILNNALKNTLIPIVTALGMSFGHLLGGTVIVENIFAWPGVGKFVVESIFNRDYPILQGYVLWMAIIFVVANLMVDLSYGLLDPRVSIGRKG